MSPVDDPPFLGPRPSVLRSAGPLLEALARYHRHEVRGLEHLPRVGAALVAVNHSLATYDGFLFGLRAMQHTGRPMAGLGDDRLFDVPGLRALVAAAGIVPASPEAGERLLREGHLVGVAPGGMREALRPSRERGQVRWEKRKGFVRLALRVGAPIVPVACPAADDLYTVYESRLTKVIYRRLHFPVPFARGLGPTWIPRPVRLVHHVGAPIAVPVGGAEDPAVVDAVHAQVLDAMRDLMARR